MDLILNLLCINVCISVCVVVKMFDGEVFGVVLLC